MIFQNRTVPKLWQKIQYLYLNKNSMRNSVYIFYEHTARSAELDEEIEERDSPMPLKINNKAHRQTGLYYYGSS